MSAELIGILAVGVALAGLLIGLFAWLRSDMAKSEERMRQNIRQVEERLRDDIKQLADRVGRLEERVGRLEHSQAKLEGLLEGLREAITGRTVAQ